MRWRFDEFMTGNINQAVLYSFTYQEDSFVSFAMQYPNSKLFTFIFWSTQTKKILRYLLGPYSVSHHRTIQALETSPLTPGSASNPWDCPAGEDLAMHFNARPLYKNNTTLLPHTSTSSSNSNGLILIAVPINK